MKKITFLIIPLLAATFAIGTFLASYKQPEKCLETFADFKTTPSSEILDAFYTILQAPADQNPDNYPVRKIGSILHGEKSLLVIVHYFKSAEDTSYEYAQAYNYDPESKKVEGIEMPATASDDKRMHLPNVVEVTCGMQMKITFHSCDACENATAYAVIAKYFPDEGKWNYAGPQFSEIPPEDPKPDGDGSTPTPTDTPEVEATPTESTQPAKTPPAVAPNSPPTKVPKK